MSAVQNRLVKKNVPTAKQGGPVKQRVGVIDETHYEVDEEEVVGVIDETRYSVIHEVRGRRIVHCHRDTRAEAEIVMKRLPGKAYIIPPSEGKVKSTEPEPGEEEVNEMVEGKSIPNSLINLSTVTDRLLDRFMELRGRLSSVLKRADPEELDISDEFNPGECDVSQGVTVQANKLSRLCVEMRDLIDRLEV